MADSAKLHKVVDAALKQAGEESSMLLGRTLSVIESDSLNTNKMTYFSDMEDAMFVAGVESREEYPGQFYMIFSLRDAILLSSMLLGIPPARITEKRRLAIMEPDDCDAFGEILNQIIGSFNSIFKPRFPLKVHLKLLVPKKFIPGIDEQTELEPIPEGEYRLFRAPLQMEGSEMDRVDILIPLPLVNLFEPGEEASVELSETEESGIDASTDEAIGKDPLDGSSEAHTDLAQQAILILEDDEFERQHIQDCLSSTGCKLIIAPPSEDIRQLVSLDDARVAVVGVTVADDRELALCIKINALCQDSPIPIIMCARRWTRTGVLKALKYGAKDILLKPYDAGELMSKVTKFLKAA